MRNFYTALYNYFADDSSGSHNDFYNDIGGRLYHADAPDDAEFPYCVLKHVVNTQIDTFSNKMDSLYIQFSIYSDLSSGTEIHDILSDLKLLFDDAVFTV